MCTFLIWLSDVQGVYTSYCHPYCRVVGYLLAFVMGMVDTTAISHAEWFALPKFNAPVFDLNAIIIIAPICIVILAEHISHLIVTGRITESNLIENPGYTALFWGMALAMFCQD